MEWDTVYEEFKRLSWIVLLVLSLLSYFLLSPLQTFGTIAGGLLIIANFNILRHTLNKLLENDKTHKRRQISLILISFLRIFALGLIMAILVLKRWADPFGLAIGLSTVVIAITLTGIMTAFKMKNSKVF